MFGLDSSLNKSRNSFRVSGTSAPLIRAVLV